MYLCVQSAAVAVAAALRLVIVWLRQLLVLAAAVRHGWRMAIFVVVVH